MSEVDFYGLYIPVLLIEVALAYILFTLSNRLIDILNDRGWIMYPNIFYFCWYLVCLLIVHTLYHWLFS